MSLGQYNATDERYSMKYGRALRWMKPLGEILIKSSSSGDSVSSPSKANIFHCTRFCRSLVSMRNAPSESNRSKNFSETMVPARGLLYRRHRR
jgi:hypothetical protein